MFDMRLTEQSTGQLKWFLGNLRESIAFSATAPVVRELAVRFVRRRFLQQVTPEGTPWAPLSPSTSGGRGILFKTGALYRSIRVDPSVAAGQGPRANAGLRLGRAYGFRIVADAKSKHDGFPYGYTHQFGYKGGNVPARKFLGISQGEAAAIRSAMENYIKQRGLLLASGRRK